jgi:hypothetical protein
MQAITIYAVLNNNKKSEFFQVMESLKTLVSNYCQDLDVKVNQDNSLIIRILFNNKKDLEMNFGNKEFNILKGSIRSLCNNVEMEISSA